MLIHFSTFFTTKSSSMDQLQQHTKSDPLLEYSGFLSTESLDYFSNNEKEISWPDDPPMMKVKAENKLLREEDHDEEIMKIRHELELDVERDLEEEIKEGIYHLALRLHRLHQHRKQRTKRESKNNNNIGGRLFEKEETYSEVNINIKMEGGTKIQIKETKKNDNKITTKPHVVNKNYIDSSRSSPSSKKPKKFDWINSLRSDSGPVIMTKKIHGNQASMMSNINHGGGGHRLHRGAISFNNDREPLDLGWKI